MYSARSATVSVSRCATSLIRFGGGSWARRGLKNADAKMRPMVKTLGAFRAALLIGWVALGAAGVLYAQFKGIPNWAALPLLAAFLAEYPFYLLPAFPEIRKRLAEPVLPLFLLVSLFFPYVIGYATINQLSGLHALQLAALALAL